MVCLPRKTRKISNQYLLYLYIYYTVIVMEWHCTHFVLYLFTVFSSVWQNNPLPLMYLSHKSEGLLSLDVDSDLVYKVTNPPLYYTIINYYVTNIYCYVYYIIEGQHAGVNTTFINWTLAIKLLLSSETESSASKYTSFTTWLQSLHC